MLGNIEVEIWVMKNVLFSFCAFLFSFASCHSKTIDNDALTKDSLGEKLVSRKDSTNSFTQKKTRLNTEPDSIQPHTTLDSLQGVWISAEDKGDHVVIHGHHYYESNAGDTSKSELYLADTCISNRGELTIKRQSGRYLMVYDAGYPTDGFCYFIHSIDDEDLELDYINGRMLNFHKAKVAHNKKKEKFK